MKSLAKKISVLMWIVVLCLAIGLQAGAESPEEHVLSVHDVNWTADPLVLDATNKDVIDGSVISMINNNYQDTSVVLQTSRGTIGYERGDMFPYNLPTSSGAAALGYNFGGGQSRHPELPRTDVPTSHIYDQTMLFSQNYAISYYGQFTGQQNTVRYPYYPTAIPSVGYVGPSPVGPVSYGPQSSARATGHMPSPYMPAGGFGSYLQNQAPGGGYTPPTSNANNQNNTTNNNSSQNTGTVSQEASDFMTPYEMEVLELINKERTEKGLVALKADPVLHRAAQIRAKEALFNWGLAHTRPNKSAWSTVLAEVNFTTYKTVGENLAASSNIAEPAASMVKGWRESPGHYANYMNGDFKTCGLAFFIDASATTAEGHKMAGAHIFAG